MFSLSQAQNDRKSKISLNIYVTQITLLEIVMFELFHRQSFSFSFFIFLSKCLIYNMVEVEIKHAYSTKYYHFKQCKRRSNIQNNQNLT